MKLFVLTVLAFTSLSTLSEASGLPRAVEKEILAKTSQMAQTNRASLHAFTGDSCEDFSGSWAGSCSIGSEKKDVSFTATQDGCKSIKINEEELKVGGRGVVGENPEPGTFVSASWNTGFTSDGKALLMNAVFSADLFNYALPIGGRMFGVANKRDNQLYVAGSVTAWALDEVGNKDRIACVLQKQ